MDKAYEVRINMVGTQAFATAIRAESAQAYIDWRTDYDHHAYSDSDIPDDVLQSISAMLRELGLVFGAFDFVVTPNGRWVFLEVNPNGQWEWIEAMTSAPISLALAEQLAKGIAP